MPPDEVGAETLVPLLDRRPNDKALRRCGRSHKQNRRQQMKGKIAALLAGIVLGSAGVGFAAHTGNSYDLYPNDQAEIQGLDLNCAYLSASSIHSRGLFCSRSSLLPEKASGIAVAITATDVRVFQFRASGKYLLYRHLRNP
jgi:hypothetical protein